MAALRTRILPGLLPDDFEQRMALLPGMAGPPIGPFPASLDLFGDGSVRLVDLPGHAEGQVGAFVRGADGVEWFLAADACWSRTTIFSDERRPPHLWLHRAIAVDRALQELTYARLRDLRRSHPRVEIIPSHCRAAAAALLSGKNAWRD
jgi:glyoxylase-like metal-dependent hydrolase (beta-lactamase superfamily II)